MKWRTLLGLAACLALLTSQVQSSELNWLNDNWELTGFVTLGYTNTTKYDDRTPRRNVYQSGQDLRENGFLLDSRAGIQLKGQLSDHWEFITQGVLREQLSNDFEDYIDLAFFRYRAGNEWQFGVGRQSFDLFFLSDHRNVGYSADWIRPPTEFYGFLPFDYYDGLKVTREWGEFDSNWRWSASIGKTGQKFDVFVNSGSGDIDSSDAERIYSTELSWNSFNWQLRANAALLKFGESYGDLLADDAETERQLAALYAVLWPDFERLYKDVQIEANIYYYSLGAAWQKDDWKVQAEWNRIETDYIGFAGERAYLHVSHRFDEFVPYVTFGVAQDDDELRYQAPPSLPEIPELELAFDLFYQSFEKEIQAMHHNQESISVGVRWDFASQRAVKLQCDQFYFKKGSGSIHGRVDGRYDKDETRSWCSASLDMVF